MLKLQNHKPNEYGKGRPVYEGPSLVFLIYMKEIRFCKSDQHYKYQGHNRQYEQGEGETEMKPAVFIKIRLGSDCPPSRKERNEAEDRPYIYIEKNYTIINDVIDEKHKLHQYK